MYFRKVASKTIKDPRARLQYAVSEHAYHGRKERYRELLDNAQEKALIADIAASVVVGLGMSGHLNADFFVSRQLDFCRDIICNSGFQDIPFQAMREDLMKDRRHIILLVLGCQDDRMLRRRVAKLVEVMIGLYESGSKFSVALSGSCPKDDEVRIANEATRMQIIFREMMTEKKPDLVPVINAIPISSEEKSSTTAENIKEFFAHKDFRDIIVNSSVILISSTFHFIRAVGEIKKDEARWQGAQWYLAGAEDHISPKYHGGLLTADLEYLKLMLFDLYNTHIS